ncbi:hypothetical protein BOX15_Mlig003991g2 [Macrostomum lignano]|uniref:Cadherin domain-containing protein n=3 Tax=Macrostomum lignano TaxID=282301 RepID=A0A267DKT8_9PLAT|nr:hypothetical protein BOX15_Mlig003991g2 [Macrostomum lignano]
MPLSSWRELLTFAVALTTVASHSGVAALYTFEKAIEISEESQPQALGNVAALGNLSRHLTSAGPLSYALEMHDAYVSVDSSSGEIRLKASIDLETICRSTAKCPHGGRHAFSVVVRELPPPTQPQLQGRRLARGRFTLIVRDINDHAPRFQSTYEEIQRDESVCLVPGVACPNPRVDLPIAKDDDFSPELSRVTYTIDPASASPETLETFELNVDEYGNPYLLMKKGLDAERQQSYQFDLVAQDGHGRKGRITVRVVIKDVNDNSPEFESKRTSVRVSEDKAKGYVIAKLKARDKDLIHELEYSIDASSPEESRRHFDILSDGSLSIKEPLDYETQAVFFMQVKVSDGRFEDKTVVEVNVEDANDNAPEYEESGQLQIQEGREAGERIGSVRVFDRDSGTSGEVECETRSQHNNRLLSVKFAQLDSPNMFSIHSTKTFDRERDSVVTGTLVCWDRGQPSLTSTYTARVAILDKNDNAPRFLGKDASGIIEAQLMENNRPGAIVTTLKAEDADEGENARLAYRLVGNGDEEFFDIDSVTGEVSARRSFDRERKDSYRLQLEVSDAGQPALTGTAQLRVSITDENDNSPQFKGVTAFQVTENTAPPVLLGVMTASDADVGLNGQVFFTQLSHAHMDRFRVDMNGSLVVTAKLDREEISEYSIPVRVSDRAAAPHSKSTDQLVLVRVLDVNDETPRIIQPASGGNSTGGNGAVVTISIYTHHPGALVQKVHAVDGDEGVNGQISYSLTQDRGSKFSIDANTGEIKVARALDVSDMTRHKLMVQASDRDPVHPRSDAKVIYVDVNDAAPPPSNLLDEAELAAAHTRRNVIIIVILAAVSAVLAIILIIAITCVNRPAAACTARPSTRLAWADEAPSGPRRRRRTSSTWSRRCT